MADAKTCGSTIQYTGEPALACLLPAAHDGVHVTTVGGVTCSWTLGATWPTPWKVR